MTAKETIFSKIKYGLIVSCQSEPPEPLAREDMLTAMAEAAIMGGAVGIRANLPHNIAAMRQRIQGPIIGIYKEVYPHYEVFITPTLKEAGAVIKSGCEILALDATSRKRPHGEILTEMVKTLRAESDVLLMADISTREEGLRAAELGFDLIGTTLSGYTDYTLNRNKMGLPDYELILTLVNELGSDVPVIAEGRIRTPEQAVKALESGAFAVVVGTAITRPWAITERFTQALRRYRR
jgi:N-acylglucosamine-6-phosphate 2-epimerase